MLNVVVTATGPLFTLEEAKTHLRVDGGDEDAQIEVYCNGAVAHVLQYCNLATVPDGEVPEAAFKTAALMVLSVFYDRRPLNEDEKRSVETLIDPYRWLRV